MPWRAVFSEKRKQESAFSPWDIEEVSFAWLQYQRLFPTKSGPRPPSSASLGKREDALELCKALNAITRLALDWCVGEGSPEQRFADSGQLSLLPESVGNILRTIHDTDNPKNASEKAELLRAVTALATGGHPEPKEEYDAVSAILELQGVPVATVIKEPSRVVLRNEVGQFCYHQLPKDAFLPKRNFVKQVILQCIPDGSGDTGMQEFDTTEQREDYQRRFDQGEFHYVGVRAVALVAVPSESSHSIRAHEFASGGCWGVEFSGGEPAEDPHLKELASEELEDLLGVLETFHVQSSLKELKRLAVWKTH